MDRPYSQRSCGKILSQTELLAAFMTLTKGAHPSDWNRRLGMVLRHIGFNRYMLSIGSAPVAGDPLAGIITTFPNEWLDQYRSNGLIGIDPILKHCRHELVPIFWDEERRRARGRAQEFWQQRIDHGLQNGISIPLRFELLKGTLSVAFDAEQAQAYEACCSEAVSQLFMLIPFMMSGLRHQLVGPAPSGTPLTPKETECLQWAGMGKTTWEISHIVGCSERTIDFHLLNARRKLGAVSRQHAVSSAAGRGLIAPRCGTLSYNEKLYANVNPVKLRSRS
jgi:LuxR family quorum-sensing transcriptional regulator LasR